MGVFKQLFGNDLKTQAPRNLEEPETWKAAGLLHWKISKPKI
jgi:hypothetical protein